MINILKPFSISDQIFFSQRLSLLLDSNISLVESLKIIKSMDFSKKRIIIYENIIIGCDRGVSLSKSIQNSTKCFDPLLINLIKNGEYSGSLSQSLLKASKNIEKRNELKKKILSSLIYPIFIFITTICMSLFLVLYIFPKILPMLGTLNIKLPLLTVIIKFIYESSIKYGLYSIIISIVIITLCIYLINKYDFLKSNINLILLKLPIIGFYIKINTNTSICGIGEMLLSSGCSLSDFHIFSRDSSINILYKNVFRDIYLQSIQGISFSFSMSNYPLLFSQTMIDMCKIGEKTGNLSQMMGYCSVIFDQDIDIFLKRFSVLIEPILMIFMGLIVGSIALSIILPIYEITNHLNK